MAAEDWVCARCQTLNQDWRNWCQQCSLPREHERGVPPPTGPAPSTTSINSIVVVAVVVALVAAAGVAFVFLRGGESTTKVAAPASSSPGPTTTTLAQRTPEQQATDEATAQGVLLQVGDMPAGWTAESNSEGGSISASELVHDSNFTACSGTDSPGASELPTEVSSDILIDGEGRVAHSQVAVYANEGLAKDDLAALRDRDAKRCIGELVDRDFQAIAAGVSIPPEVNYTNAVTSDLAPGNVHADFVALRASVPIQAGQEARHVTVDLVYARKGRTIITMRFLSAASVLPVDFQLLITNVVVDRAPAA
jgi:hypothetical protein